MSKENKRIFSAATIAIVVLAFAGFLQLCVFSPWITARLCPSCYGFRKINSLYYADKRMDIAAVAATQDVIVQAKAEVGQYFPDMPPTLILVCETESCFRSISNTAAAKAVFFHLGVLVVSPRGINADILDYELTTAALVSALGETNFRKLPTQFISALAKSISDRSLAVSQASSCRNQKGRGPDGDAKCLSWLWLAQNLTPSRLASLIAELQHGRPFDDALKE